MIYSPYTVPTNRFVLDDFVSPLCRTPEGAEIVRKLDERGGYGIDAPFLVYTGRNLAEFSFELILKDDAAWQYYETTFRPLLQAVPNRGPVDQSSGAYTPGRAHLIWHPQLYNLGITQCVVAKECIERKAPEPGAWVVPVYFRQVKQAPKQAMARPEAPTVRAPLTPDELQVKALADELASKRQIDAMGGR